MAAKKDKLSSFSEASGLNHRKKYLQLVDYINTQIENNQLAINDRLPSLKQLTDQLNISKETALKGLNYLSEKGIIESEYRKGYYVRKKAQYHPYNICLILDKMNVLRDRIYHSFLETVKDQADVDVYFHHHNFAVFQKLIEENLNNYTHFVLTTFFREDSSSVINSIPPHKRVIIDYQEKNLKGDFTCIYQDYKSDIIDSLTELKPRLSNYKRLVLIAHPEAFHGHDIIAGFEKFCKSNGNRYSIFDEVTEDNIKLGDAIVAFSRYDQDDVDIIKIAHKNNWKLGNDIGLISYNDTAVKEVLENGITVISTDFNKMGEEAAKAILNKQTVTMRDPARVILRNSL